jgi:AcrR family transcriptional regulator
VLGVPPLKIKILGTDHTVEIPNEPHTTETEEQVFENLVRHRQRAAAMSPEGRRQAIIAATLPLLSEHGANVTTSQIARAAGIAEGTIFRVFPEKRDLLVAALRTAMSGEAEVARIREISLDLPLAERLVGGLKAIEHYQQRFWALMRVFRETGWVPERDALEHGRPGEHPMAAIRNAIQGLIEPDAASLRIDPHSAAGLLLSLSFSRCMGEHGMGEPSTSVEQLVELFLHGALQFATGEASAC